MPSEIEIEYDRTVREDIELFRQTADSRLRGEITDDEFRQHRLRRGVYGQRQVGVQMIRTKVPGGLLTSRQMHELASISDKFAAGKAHLTTRQNVQYHFVPLAQVADLLHQLADVRMTTREACYNTVRNVTACPTAGLLRNEIFNVNPYARDIAFAFLHKELTDNMPRKFKIALCGCKEDCMLGAIHDVGLRAVVRTENGVEQRGFRMVVGGGLGPLPSEAQLLDEFIPEALLIQRIEAVIRVFNKFGNRGNKNKARLKFILRERGFAWVRDEIENNYKDILETGGIATPTAIPEGFGGFQANPQPLGSGALLPILPLHSKADPDFDRWLETNVEEQKQPGYSLVTVKVAQGNLTSGQMHGLADLATNAGEGILRFTISQNVLLGFIPVANLRRVYTALQGLDLAEAGASEVDDVLSCPGAYSCNLALTKSMNLGEALSGMMKGHPDPLIRKLKINISGCPNSCGQHWISDFGFYGNARKVEGKEIPYYQVLLGGGYDENGVIRFGLTIQSVPAKLAPVVVLRVIDHFRENRLEGERFRDYVLRYKVETFRAMTKDLAKPIELNPDLYMDWGDDVNFSLQLGRGDCAA